MFITLEDGNLVNAAEIARVRLVRKARGHEWFVVMRDGDRLRVHEDQVSKLARDGALLPSRAGDTAVVVSLSDKSGGADYAINELPIVGWIVSGTGDSVCAYPVLVGAPAPNQRVGVLLPRGRVCVAGHTTHESRGAFAKEEARRHRAQVKSLREASR